MDVVLRRIALALIAAQTLTAAEAAGQVVCSAPHSSPTLTQNGAIRTLPPGSGWAQVSVLRQHSTEFYNPRGAKQVFLSDAAFTTRSIFATAAVGVMQGLELWAQLPVHRLAVDAAAGESRSTGVGDVRAAARIGPALIGQDLPLAVRAAVKIPGSRFPVDATVLPLTEGQRDWEVSLETGAAFAGIPIYVVGWGGYRWREMNEEAARDPGDERFGHLAVGGAIGALVFELGLDGLLGATPRAQGLALDAERRRLLQLLPTLGWRVGPGTLDITAQVPLAGRNLPAGNSVSFGYRTLWGTP